MVTAINIYILYYKYIPRGIYIYMLRLRLEVAKALVKAGGGQAPLVQTSKDGLSCLHEALTDDAYRHYTFELAASSVVVSHAIVDCVSDRTLDPPAAREFGGIGPHRRGQRRRRYRVGERRSGFGGAGSCHRSRALACSYLA